MPESVVAPGAGLGRRADVLRHCRAMNVCTLGAATWQTWAGHGVRIGVALRVVSGRGCRRGRDRRTSIAVGASHAWQRHGSAGLGRRGGVVGGRHLGARLELRLLVGGVRLPIHWHSHGHAHHRHRGWREVIGRVLCLRLRSRAQVSRIGSGRGRHTHHRSASTITRESDKAIRYNDTNTAAMDSVSSPGVLLRR